MTATEAKTKFNLKVEYQDKTGNWVTAEGSREFALPDEEGKIEVTYVKPDGKEQGTEVRKFKRLVLRSREDVLEALGDENSTMALLYSHAYGSDLLYRSVIKVPIVAEVEGPGRVIAKLADDIIKSYRKLGKSISEEEALAAAQKMHDLLPK